MTERVTHCYRVVILVTKENCKELERNYRKLLSPGNTLYVYPSVNGNGGLKPNLTMDKIYRDVANDLGGTAEYQYEKTTISDWKVL